MTPKEKLTKARIRLVLSQPFFATLALSMEYIETTDVETSVSDGIKIKYNPLFIDKLTVDETVGLLAHEVMHPAMLHHLRIIGKDYSLFNKAADYAINPLLKEAGIVLPSNALISDKYKNMYVEEIYAILEKEEKNNKDENNNSGNQGDKQGEGVPRLGVGKCDPGSPEGWGQIEAYNYEAAGESLAEAEKNAKQRLIQAFNAAKVAGSSTSGVKEFIDKIIETKTPWAEILQRFIAEVSNNDYTWTQPSRRYLPMGVYLPTLKNEEMGKVVFAIDTSGSIDKELLKIFASELQSASQLFKFPVTVIHCDTKIKKTEELEQDKIIEPIGGGGTDFRPPFEYVNKNIDDCKALVYLTDGECSKFPDEPDYPTLWAIYDNNKFSAPFGEAIIIK